MSRARTSGLKWMIQHLLAAFTPVSAGPGAAWEPVKNGGGEEDSGWGGGAGTRDQTFGRCKVLETNGKPKEMDGLRQ